MALAYSTSGNVGKVSEVDTAYIVATGNDTTASVTGGRVIDNRDGRVSFLSAAASVTNKAGTSPTLQLLLKGSNDGTNFFQIKADDGSTNVAGSADSISGAPTVVAGQFDSESKTVRPGSFPPFLRVDVALGGTSPGWTGSVCVNVNRLGSVFTKP